MFAGLKFDLSATLYLNSLFIVFTLLPFKFRFNKQYKRGLNALFFIPNIIGIVANVSDFIYYRFTLKRTTSSVFDFVAGEDNMGKLFSRFIFDYWYATLFGVLLIVSFIFIARKVKYGETKFKNPYLHFGINLLILFVFSGLSVAGMRGGFLHSTRPITLSNAAKYVDQPEETAIVLNTPFSIIRTIDKEDLKRMNFYASSEELNAVYSPIFQGSIDTMKQKNVVIFILESFNREYVGFLNRDLDGGTYKGYTPFLDSLMENSLVFENAFANGRKSIDAIPAVVSGIPAMQMPYILSHHSSNRINSIAGVLSEQGYESMFFHGAPNGSMGFQAFCKLAGFDAYYGKDEFDDKRYYDGIWGIWDEPFLQFMGRTLSATKKPFFSTVFTLSSHHPYKVPKEYEGVFDKGTLPVHQCVGYTDNALRKFFAYARNQDWYENTLFVFTADHSSSSTYNEHKNSLGYYSIPIFFYSANENDSLKGRIANEIQQTDISPTILNYINYPNKYLAFGNDAFDSKSDHFAVNFTNNFYQFVQNGYVLHFDGTKSVALYNYSVDKGLKKNIIGENTEVVLNMENTLKAYIQHYNNRVLDNAMTP